ncbi:MAG TPA: helix-turn-helix domain-containing protein [Streptosporangiaceae bacterium]|nr:helix-turn-helix domain-containing protein [Streptosporangiaceae bacterium]
MTRRQRLIQRRKALGLTQEALAELVDVGRSTVVRWERGESEPLPSIRARLARALQVSAESLESLLAAGDGRDADMLRHAEHHLGNLGEAAACYQHALSLHREAGDRFTEAEALAHLGETYQAAGNLAQAREAWQQAVVIFDDMRNHDAAARVRAMLAGTGLRAPSGSAQPEEPARRR